MKLLSGTIALCVSFMLYVYMGGTNYESEYFMFPFILLVFAITLFLAEFNQYAKSKNSQVDNKKEVI
ncbi:hypothetical protein [Viridibacillus arvi]|uniref:hypothetical protein n=1 Tax=Viridibacillus arvi TaxID=263475 RepID=UPI0034CE17D3